MLQNPVFTVLLFAVGLAAGYFVRRQIAASRAGSLERELASQVEAAKTESKKILAEAEAKASSFIEEAKREEKSRLQQLDRTEDRLSKREEALDERTRSLQSHEAELKEALSRTASERAAAEETKLKATREIERVAGVSAEAARRELFQKLEEEHRGDLAHAIQKLERDRREEIEKKSLEIMTTAIHRYARSNVADVTTTVLTIPNEDLKGKIIGREGRNIRALERATGVEIIMDETPDTILFSSFDPLRREIAKVAVEKLIKDGRIQPAKIEEKVQEAQNELSKRMLSIGEQAALEVGIADLPKEILQLLGRLHFRTSYGQNVLVHSVEMAHVAGIIAAELGASVDIAKRGALLHDIGKAISHEVEGTHVELGRKLLKKYGVAEPVIRAMESHHEEYPFSSPESYIVTAADAISAARPGARRDTVENYLKRLEDLEKVAMSFDGVKSVYALSAGREVRVFVVPEKVDDFGALDLAKRIAGKIQSDLRYPGEIKVNVIREMRATEYAR
jgi:ribonuclease Y